MIEELLPEQLRRTFDHKASCIDTTENLKPLEGIIGQKRAVSALLFGLEIRETGFNIYVAGPPGMGKMTAVKSFLEEFAGRKDIPPDWCYVNNFDDSYKPKVVKLPAGRGRQLQQDMKSLIEHIQREIPNAFESEEYGARRDEIAKSLESQRSKVLERFNTRANEAGFTIEATSFGIIMIPTHEGRPLSDAELAALPVAARDDIQRKRDLLQEEFKSGLKQVRDIEREAHKKMEELDRKVALYIVGGLIDDLEEKYRDLPEIVEYLRAVQKDILENIKIFKSGQAGTAAQALEGLSLPAPWLQEMPFRRYQVNVLVDNSRLGGAPVVVELNPSYNNLFGRIEKETQLGALFTDFTMIKAGSLHRANGGFLVVPVEDVLRNLLSWDSLKRALRSREIQIEEPGERLGFLTTKSLRPEPVGFDIKVVLIGHPMIYYLLQAYDEEFPELFKVKADFDTRMECTDENIQDFLAFLSTFCRKENLKPLDSGAAARLLEHAARLAEHQEKLSTHFGALVDVVREAHFWAQQDGAVSVSVAHMQRSLDQKVYRSNLIQERINEMIARGTILIDVAGQAVGQVNGLSVISLGDYVFGKPSKITASVEPGQGGIVDIEREVELGGPIHSKGILILGGYLAQKYAQERPLTLAARLVFEQSYDGVEGDSASSTELYALLSALSGLPIKQGIAVTGSVNQHGQVQAIGGVNQKIEGFFDVCKAKGMTGEQGVIIPQNNVKNLMLREDVVDAVRSKKFHIWAAKTIDEGIEILTGVPNGDRRRDGTFPDGTLSYIVEKRLQGFAESMKELSKDEKPPRARKKAKKK